MIISIRGTHGSGKSTIIRNLLDRYPNTPMPGEKKPLGYRIEIPWLKKPLMVLGSYENACGGCDSIQPYSLIWPRIEEYAKIGHVIFEGALTSSSYGNIGRASEVFGDNVVFAFLDTPLELCLERINIRRAAKGQTEPVNPKNTTSKYKNVLRSIWVIRDQWKRRVVMLDHRHPIPKILGLLKNAKD